MSKTHKSYFYLLGSLLMLGACKSTQPVATLESKHDLAIDVAEIKEKTALSDARYVIPFKVYPMDIAMDRSSEVSRQVSDKLTDLYEMRSHLPLWITNRGPKRPFVEMISQLESSMAHGIDSSLYQIASLKRRVNDLRQNELMISELVELESDISRTYLTYCYHLTNGIINPEEISTHWHLDERNLKMVEKLAKVSTSNQLRDFQKDLLPSGKSYERMMDWLNYYRKLEDFEEIARPYKTIEPDSSHMLIPAVRKRLAVTYKRIDAENNSLIYDNKLQRAVRDFQRRHGLEVDGRIGNATISAMNTPWSEKIERIEVNMERMRWLPHSYGTDYLVVNIPSYQLRVYKKKKKKLEMRVIVGKEYTQTPIFSDTLKYIVFSPTWTVPNSIKTKEMLPRLQRNPSHYSSRNYVFYKGWSSEEVDPATIDWSAYSASNFPFNVVQQPGPSNALGLVKFIMPNDMSIYLHDTPTDYLFNRNERAFSHGCVRLERPAELAHYLLQDKRWERDDIRKAMHQDEPQRVYLSKNYHVQITYLTSFVDEGGDIHFRDDIYGYDQSYKQETSKLITTYYAQ